MALLLRFYATEQAATDAHARLVEAGFDDQAVLLASEHRDRAASAVEAAIRAGTLPERMVKLCTRSLEQGRSIVSANPPFGRGQRALDILESSQTVDSHLAGPHVEDDPAPLSRMLGIAVLSEFSSSTGLLRSDWSVSAGFGFGLLSRKAAPLSSMFGMRVLSAAKRDRRSSFGMPLRSQNPAPLSSLLGMRPVSSRQRRGTYSFGFPLLSRNPAPLSSLLGIRTLSRGR